MFLRPDFLLLVEALLLGLMSEFITILDFAIVRCWVDLAMIFLSSILLSAKKMSNSGPFSPSCKSWGSAALCEVSGITISSST